MKPIATMLYGEAGCGKSYLAASLFDTTLLDPERVLYLDNHGSTDHLELPQYEKGVREYGVFHVDSDEPELLIAMAQDKIIPAVAAGKPLYDAIVIDDISEHDLTSMENRTTTGFDAWREQLSDMSNMFRLYKPSVTKAHLIVTARAAMLPDYMEKKRKGGKEDSRSQILRPMVRGQFGVWMLGECQLILLGDLVDSETEFWPDAQGGGPKAEYRWLTAQSHDPYVKNRFIHLDSMPKQYLVNPTYDNIITAVGGN